MLKCLKIGFQKQKILKRICEKYALPKYNKYNGEPLSYTLYAYSDSRFDPLTGKRTKNWCRIKVCANLISYLESISVDRHGKEIKRNKLV